MRISDSVANYILELLNQAGGIAEIQRNELASFLGCVPSQINYVLTSRFTPEQGYIVESTGALDVKAALAHARARRVIKSGGGMSDVPPDN